jgi:dihydrolipoamide dehydrogenase
VAEPAIDVATMQARKEAVVKGLTDGVAFLFRKNKIEWVRGFGRLASPESIEVTAQDGSVTTLRAKHIVLAPGSVPSSSPSSSSITSASSTPPARWPSPRCPATWWWWAAA